MKYTIVKPDEKIEYKINSSPPGYPNLTINMSSQSIYYFYKKEDEAVFNVVMYDMLSMKTT